MLNLADNQLAHIHNFKGEVEACKILCNIHKIKNLSTILFVHHKFFICNKKIIDDLFDLRGDWKGPHLIGGISEVFGVLRGVLEVWSNFGVPRRILNKVNQHGAPWWSVATSGTLIGEKPLFFNT